MTAIENINLLYNLENGGETTRREQLQRIHADMAKMRDMATSSQDIQECDNIIEDINSLSIAIDSPHFLNKVADILRHHQTLLDTIRKKTTRKALRRGKHSPPHLESKAWNIGLGYENFVPSVEIFSSGTPVQVLMQRRQKARV